MIGDIPDTPGVHGIALAPELSRGFISNGKAHRATMFDIKTLKVIGQVQTGEILMLYYMNLILNEYSPSTGKAKMLQYLRQLQARF